jgi:hypothetical protein
MSDPPQYRQALVSFVDILGFRDLVSSATVPQILDVLHGKETLALHRGGGFLSEPREGTTFTFSDLIVNVTSLNESNPLPGLFDELVTLGDRQFWLAVQGIFVRGGIVFGDIYINGQTIFGPALIKAYDLERVTAKWPILTFDPDLMQRIDIMAAQFIAGRREKDGQTGEFLGKAFSLQLGSLIERTDEGVDFLDYLSCAAYIDSATGDMAYFLTDHRDSLLTAHRKFRHWKYSFLAEYHDSYCRKYFSNREDLIVGKLN